MIMKITRWLRHRLRMFWEHQVNRHYQPFEVDIAERWERLRRLEIELRVATRRHR